MNDEPKNDNGIPGELLALVDAARFDLGVAGEGSLFELEETTGRLLLPGCADLQLASVQMIGHRGETPRTIEWEALLSMLGPRQEILWIVKKRRDAGFEFYLGLKDNNSPRGGPDDVVNLRQAFAEFLGQFAKRSFPESMVSVLDESQTLGTINEILAASGREVVVTSGMPSPALLEDSREFSEPREDIGNMASLNDIVEPFAGEGSFTIVFSVGRASVDEATGLLGAMAELRTALSPYLKIQTGHNRSESLSHAESTQSSETEMIGQTENRNIVSGLFQRLFGARSDEVRQTYATHEGSGRPRDGVLWAAKGLWRVGYQKALKRAPVTRQRSKTQGRTEGVTSTMQEGSSITVTSSNAALELLDQSLQDTIRSLKKAVGTGGFYLGAEVVSPRTELSLRIARVIAGTLSGARSHVRPFQTAVYRGAGFSDHLTKNVTIEEAFPAISIQSRHVAAMFLPLPESDLPGLRTKRNVFYGKPNSTETTGGVDGGDPAKVWIGELAHLKSGLMLRHRRRSEFGARGLDLEIPAEDVLSHILVAGTTGSGKTQRAVAILNRLPRNLFQVVVIETAKKTYRRLLRREGVALKILSLGGFGNHAFRINPFFFEPGTSLKRHISVLSDALADLLPVEALIGPKLREGIQNCYVSYDWDIEAGTFRGAGEPFYPTMVDLHVEVMAIARELKYGAELNSNYKGALFGRTRLFIDELYQDIFGWGGDLTLDALFGQDDVIIEMDDLPPSEAKMPSFVLSLLLERLRARQQCVANGRGPRGDVRKVLIVIEEAHNLVERRLETERSSSEMGSGGFLLRQIVRLLQEGRGIGLGMMVVDQSPASLATAVIRNTNTKIILRITDSEEAEQIGSALGLTKEESRDLHELEDGEAVLKAKNAGKALKLAPAKLIDGQADGVSSGGPGCQPDYHRAARVIRKIVRSASASASAEEDAGNGLTDDLRDLLKAAGENPSARRFFAQKLMAAVAEAVDGRCVAPRDCPDKAESLAVEIIRVVKPPAWPAMCRQLEAVLAAQSWEQAQPLFEVDTTSAIRRLAKLLQTNVHWEIMEGAVRLTELIECIVSRREGDKSRGFRYSQLLSLAHCSDERANALKGLLNDTKPEL